MPEIGGKTGAMDQRARLTKNKIVNAYIRLLNSKPYSDVRAVDIYTVAGVHKTTFYRHFKSNAEIEDYIEQSVLSVFEKMIISVSWDDFFYCRKSFLALLKSTVKSNSEFYSNALSLNQSIPFVNNLNRLIKEQVMEIIKTHTVLSEDQADIALTYAVGGRIAIYRKWVLGGFNVSEDTTSKVMEQIAFTGLEGLILDSAMNETASTAQPIN